MEQENQQAKKKPFNPLLQAKELRERLEQKQREILSILNENQDRQEETQEEIYQLQLQQKQVPFVPWYRRQKLQELKAKQDELQNLYTELQKYEMHYLVQKEEIERILDGYSTLLVKSIDNGLPDNEILSLLSGTDGKDLSNKLNEFLKTVELAETDHEKISITTFVPASICNDLPEGEDCLQIKDELTALATVLMLRKLEPPLAVGILGSWGSGKSFAMHLIRQQINKIRGGQLSVQQAWGNESADDYKKKLSPYVGHIYQIQFNAWTYARTNLWASLMQEIFYELNRQLTLEQNLKTALNKANHKHGLLEGGDYWQALYEMRQEEQQLLLKEALDEEAWEKLKHLHSQPERTENILWSALGKLRKEERDQLQATEIQIKQEQADLEAKQQQIEQEFQYKKSRQAKVARWRAFEARLALLFLELLQVRERSGKLPEKSWQANFALQIFQLNSKKVTDNTNTNSKDKDAEEQTRNEETLEIEESSTVQKDLDAFLGEVKKLTGVERITPFSLRRWIAENLVFCVLFVSSAVLLGLAIQDLPGLLTQESPDWANRFWKFLGSLVILLPTLFQIFGRISRLVRDYQTSVQHQLERIQKRQEIEREDRLAAEGITQKIQTINQLKLQAEQLRQKVGLTANYDSLMSLVQERIDGKTYSEHLGLMEQVRRDLLDLQG
ncbi:MAG: P-loop NTPase fold protein [Leptolyngbyaceae cyanobacterium]